MEEDGREPYSRPHTPEKLQHADGKSGALPAREKEVCARAERGGVRGTEFILRAFFYRSLTPRSSAAVAEESAARCSTIRLHSQGRPGERDRENLVPRDRAKSARTRHAYSRRLYYISVRIWRKYPVAVGSREIKRHERISPIIVRLPREFAIKHGVERETRVAQLSRSGQKYPVYSRSANSFLMMYAYINNSRGISVMITYITCRRRQENRRVSVAKHRFSDNRRAKLFRWPANICCRQLCQLAARIRATNQRIRY